jgi:hypothetical protein
MRAHRIEPTEAHANSVVHRKTTAVHTAWTGLSVYLPVSFLSKEVTSSGLGVGRWAAGRLPAARPGTVIGQRRDRRAVRATGLVSLGAGRSWDDHGCEANQAAAIPAGPRSRMIIR